MIFSSLEFLFLFLPIFFIVYYAVPFKVKNIVLLIASLLFYSWGEPVYVVLLIFSSVVDYTNGRLIERFFGRNGLKKFFMILSIAINLGLLGVFKYADFIVENINRLGMSIKEPALALPVGISFFTFQTMSYSIDVYRGKIKAERNFLRFMTYVCMFPQLIAGPIVRFSDVGEELKKRKHTFSDFSYGVTRFLNGLFKKVLIADNLGALWAVIKASEYSELSVLTAWLGVVCFTLQLYFDFSGYADMAVGMGRMMGFHYCENFNYPLIARSVTDFWRRWHMSLSGWFRDYVYIPLGGNRKGVLRHILNILIVWGLTGIWHGASWNFMIWGLYYGVLLICEKYIWGETLERLPSLFKHIYAVFIIIVGFGIFDLDSLSDIGEYFRVMFFAGGNPLSDSNAVYYLINYGRILLAAVVFSCPVYAFYERFSSNIEVGALKAAVTIGEWIIRYILFAAVIGAMVASSYSPFLYFRF